MQVLCSTVGRVFVYPNKAVEAGSAELLLLDICSFGFEYDEEGSLMSINFKGNEWLQGH